MAGIAEKFQSAWRDYVTDGVPSSGENRPIKAEIRPIGPAIDDELSRLDTKIDNATISGDSITRATWAQLSAITGTRLGQRGEVTATGGTHTDPVVGGTVPNKGIYGWSVSPAGWQWLKADDVTAVTGEVVAARDGNANLNARLDADKAALEAAINAVGGALGPSQGSDSPTFTDKIYFPDSEGKKRTLEAVKDRSRERFLFGGIGGDTIQQWRPSRQSSSRLRARIHEVDTNGRKRVPEAKFLGQEWVNFTQAPATAVTTDGGGVTSEVSKFSAACWPLVQTSTETSGLAHASFLPRVKASVFSWWESNPVETPTDIYFSSMSNGQAATGMPKVRQISHIQKADTSKIWTYNIGYDGSLDGTVAFNDDHDNSGIVVDPRWWAKFKLAAVSHGHNQTASKTIIQFSRSQSPAGLSSDRFPLNERGRVTYSRAYRRPDQPNLVYVFRRINTGGVYSLIIYDDDIEAIVADIDLSGLGGQIYNIPRVCRDRSGFWFVWYPNPSSTQTDTFNYASVMKLTWDLKWLDASGSTIVDMAVSGWAPSTFNPIASGTLLVPTATGDRLRLYDVREFTTGTLSVGWAWWTGEAASGTQATNYIMRYNTATPTTRTPILVGDGGKGVHDTSNFSYFGGTCFIKKNVLLSAEWAKPSNPSNSELNTYDVSGAPALKANLETTPEKYFRPQASTLVTDTSGVLDYAIGTLAVVNRGPYSGFATQACDVQPLLTASL